MMDFYEGWELRNRLIQDGFLTPYEDIANGKEMDLKIEELARKHYGWEPASPYMGEIDEKLYDDLQQQTANDRIHYLWEIAVDWDGYRTVRGLGALLDEIIVYTQIKTKSEHQVLNEIKIFNKFNSCEDFLNTWSAKVPFYWSFPHSEWENIQKWCNENGYTATFKCFNHDQNGEPLAVVFRIDKEENK